MPTPARLATASRLASAPPALKTTFAASRTRSRLRTASARGFRVVVSGGLNVRSPWGLKSGGVLRIWGYDTLAHNTGVKQTARSWARAGRWDFPGLRSQVFDRQNRGRSNRRQAADVARIWNFPS